MKKGIRVFHLNLVRNLSSLTGIQARSRFSALTNYAKTLKLQEDRLKKKLTRSTLKLYKELWDYEERSLLVMKKDQPSLKL